MSATLPQVRPGIPRLLEVVVALLGLTLVSPFVLLAMLVVRLTSPGPVVFRQQRIGRGGRPFTIFKLRTMKVDHDGPGVTGRVDTRVTPAGHWLRLTKLDEFPQLWNVVIGDMSFVGPRPELTRYVNLDNPMWKRVLEARPGITDPVTLRLKDESLLMPTAEAERERFYLETLQPFKLRGYLEYLSHRTAWSDVGVVMATVFGILRRAKPAELAEILKTDQV